MELYSVSTPFFEKIYTLRAKSNYMIINLSKGGGGSRLTLSQFCAIKMEKTKLELKLSVAGCEKSVRMWKGFCIQAKVRAGYSSTVPKFPERRGNLEPHCEIKTASLGSWALVAISNKIAEQAIVLMTCWQRTTLATVEYDSEVVGCSTLHFGILSLKTLRSRSYTGIKQRKLLANDSIRKLFS
jgi:hypothetical protein